MAKQYAEEGNYEEAIRLTKLCLDGDTRNPDKLDLFLDYEALCDYYSHVIDSDSCRHYADLALNIYEDVDGLEPLNALQLISYSLLDGRCYDRALDCRKQIFDITQSTYGSDSPQLVNEYCMLSWFYQNAGNNLLAVEYAKKEEELAYQTRNIIDDFPFRRTYKESFSSLRSVIQKCDEPIAGIQYLLKILSKHRDAIDSESRMHTLNSIWAISRDNNFLEGCLAVYKENALYGTYKEQLTNLINIDVEDLNIKNDVHAAEYAQSLYEIVIMDELTQWFSEEEIESLLGLLPDYYAKIGLVRESFEMAKRNYEWRKEKNKDLFFCDLRILISGSALPEEAAYAANFGENLLESHQYDGDKEILQIIYEKIAGAYLNLGNNERANFYIDKIGESNEYQTLRAKASIYFESGDLKSLLPISIKLNEFKDVPEDNRGIDLLMLLWSARDAREASIIQKYSSEYVNTYRTSLLNNIPFMSEEEQAKYIRNLPFSNILSYDFFIGIDDNNNIEWSVAKDAYNYSLLKKGILLTSQTEFRAAITNSTDSLIKSQWKMLQNSGSNYLLHDEVAKRNLINYASHRSSYLNKLSYTWEDVRDALHDNEAAIEFIMCYNFHDLTDKQYNPIYLALIIRKDCNEPITVALSSVLNFDHISPNDLLSCDNKLLYNLLWQPLEPYLQGISKVYFSPVENLNSVPIEYASMGTGRVCDIWELFRVSSTREIIDQSDVDRRDYAVLYGGLQYDLPRDELVAISRSGAYHSSNATRAIYNDNLRYKVKYLPGSLSEVTDIAGLFAISPFLITDTIGTEESFKSLDGTSYDIIHLATHGFFWSESDVSRHDNIRFLHDEHFQSLSKEDNAMLRSGLVFSGASVFLEGGELPDDVEDGILTASVTEFYRQYLSGKSKRQSLYLAQSALRDSEEFSEPYYWASFILLD